MMFATCWNGSLMRICLFQNVFWRSFGDIVTIAFVILLSTPAAISASEYEKELATGRLEVLSTLPGVLPVHSAMSWIIVSAVYSLPLAIISAVFFWSTLYHVSFMMPFVLLVLYSVALGKAFPHF